MTQCHVPLHCPRNQRKRKEKEKKNQIKEKYTMTLYIPND